MPFARMFPHSQVSSGTRLASICAGSSRALGLSLMFALTLSACANDADRTRAEGAGAGALAGSVLAKVLGAKTGGVVGGAVGGGLVGLIVGDQVASKKAAYSSTEDQLRASVARAQQVAKQARTYNEQLRQQIASLTQSRDKLNRQVMDAQTRNRIAQEDSQKTAALIRQTNDTITNVRQEIVNQQRMIEQASASGDTSPEKSADIERVNSSVSDLQMQERALQQAEAQLKLIDQRRAY